MQQVNSFLGRIGYLAAFVKVLDVDVMFSVLDLGFQLLAVLSAFFKLQFLQLLCFGSVSLVLLEDEFGHFRCGGEVEFFGYRFKLLMEN